MLGAPFSRETWRTKRQGTIEDTMRIAPNLPRLRAIALGCWAVGGWCIVYGARLAGEPFGMPLLLSAELLGLLLLAIGLAFWLLSNDYRAGIVFDAKGILLNLGHSAAFIGWDNIARIGVTQRRDSLLAIGSRRQIGIRLREVEQYVQSYEQRLPAARGVFGRAVGLLAQTLRPQHQADDYVLREHLSNCRAQTNYDVLIPEALLGGKAEAFAALLECYRLQPDERRTLESPSLLV